MDAVSREAKAVSFLADHSKQMDILKALWGS